MLIKVRADAQKEKAKTRAEAEIAKEQARAEAAKARADADVTREQVRADTQVKTSQIRADAEIREAHIRAYAEIVKAEIGADVSKTQAYTDFITYALNDTVAIGPQFESVLGLGENSALWALNFGGRLNIGYGENNTLGLYVGYETKKEEGETGLTGRMNFTRRW